MPVVFSYSEWTARYPELATVSSVLAQLYFYEACLYIDNSATSAIPYAQAGDPRDLILNMLTAHIAALNATVAGVAPSPLVGRIASAGEGSVNVQTVLEVPGSAAWFVQTKYGAAAWQALLPYRQGGQLISPDATPSAFPGGWPASPYPDYNPQW